MSAGWSVSMQLATENCPKRVHPLAGTAISGPFEAAKAYGYEFIVY
jgi:hypothetical protein